MVMVNLFCVKKLFAYLYERDMFYRHLLRNILCLYPIFKLKSKKHKVSHCLTVTLYTLKGF